MIALEVLLLFVALLFAVLVYRWLIHSKWFANLLGGCAPDETNREVIDGHPRGPGNQSAAKPHGSPVEVDRSGGRLARVH